MYSDRRGTDKNHPGQNLPDKTPRTNPGQNPPRTKTHRDLKTIDYKVRTVECDARAILADANS